MQLIRLSENLNFAKGRCYGNCFTAVVGLTSLSPGQTVLLDTSVPPPPTPAVAHFQPSCTEPQTIALS